ncbi:hypothetical protein PHAMO_30161 [Magnetospirillum molischianum DSM 120]|uniref:Uncharacterized protein n=1 Tax=Magnetospirillum molischianum DSM 120 TaxID=1150626 RepID=H8FUG7_MAGML|nr:hypothetical protein PHAMO_30161 [Magnetospirillum molischianum DSM 120]
MLTGVVGHAAGSDRGKKMLPLCTESLGTQKLIKQATDFSTVRFKPAQRSIHRFGG